jgi:hypothetical protein
MLKETINIVSFICLLVIWHIPAWAELNDGLIAHYPFNGNAIDETGNGYDGTVHGAALCEDRFGNPQNAYSFDGLTSYIDIGTTLNFPCGNYAVSVWFLNNGEGPHVNGYGQKIMSKANFFNDFYIAVFTEGHGEPNTGALFWQQYQGTGSGPKAIFDLDYNYLDNKWHHAVVNKEDNYGEMWVDGQLIGTADTLTDVCNSQHLYIGFTDHTDPLQRQEGHWNGKIDNIRIYDRSLSECEITQLSGYDSDCDGIPDNSDNCPNSKLTETVIIDGCDTDVDNFLSSDGCNISDKIQMCAESSKNHGNFVSCVAKLTNTLKKDGIITCKKKGTMQQCAAHADIP